MTNNQLQKALQILTKKALNKPRKKGEKGFTLIELMIVVAIVGVLSAVALPQLLKAQDTAKDNVALQNAVNAGKTCSIALIGGVASDGDTATLTGDVTHTTTTCEEGAEFVYVGPINTHTVTLEGIIPGTPVTEANEG